MWHNKDESNSNMEVMEMYKDKKLYCCFSVPQRRFLEERGIKYEVTALSPNTKSMMWIFVRDEKLDKALEQWGLGKKA